MTTEPKKTYDIFEALERFAKPDIKQRLTELKPFANGYNAESEKLHNEYIALAFANADFLVGQLIAGKLLSRDYAEGHDHSQPKKLIDPGHWRGVDIDPRTGYICNEDGAVFPTVEIWDAAEEEESKVTPEEIPHNGLPLTNMRFHVDADGKRVLFDLGVELRGTSNNLFRCLFALHCQELNRSITPDEFRAVSPTEISKALKIGFETVATTVKRTRGELSKKFAEAGVLCGSVDIIETQRTAGYRLNPDLQHVAFHQLKAKGAQ